MRKTRSEFAIWLEKYIDLHYDGNNAAAGREWGVNRATVHAVLNTRIKPTDAILCAVEWNRKDVEYYEKKD